MTVSGRMPVLFIGHGSPLGAIAPGPACRVWQDLGRTLPVPRAIVVISAHWYGPGTRVTTAAAPEQIHDYYGFPDELYRVRYRAPGDPELAAAIVALLPGSTADAGRGLDHGVWMPLLFLRPDATVPVVAISLAADLAPEDQAMLAMRLAPLRDDGVLVVGSGNIVHNLARISASVDDPAVPDWAREHDLATRDALVRHDLAALVSPAGAAARLAIPHPDHWLPLVWTAALAGTAPVSFPYEGFQHGSLSMRAVRWD